MNTIMPFRKVQRFDLVTANAILGHSAATEAERFIATMVEDAWRGRETCITEVYAKLNQAMHRLSSIPNSSGVRRPDPALPAPSNGKQRQAARNATRRVLHAMVRGQEGENFVHALSPAVVDAIGRMTSMEG